MYMYTVTLPFGDRKRLNHSIPGLRLDFWLGLKLRLVAYDAKVLYMYTQKASILFFCLYLFFFTHEHIYFLLTSVVCLSVSLKMHHLLPLSPLLLLLHPPSITISSPALLLSNESVSTAPTDSPFFDLI